MTSRSPAPSAAREALRAISRRVEEQVGGDGGGDDQVWTALEGLRECISRVSSQDEHSTLTKSLLELATYLRKKAYDFSPSAATAVQSALKKPSGKDSDHAAQGGTAFKTLLEAVAGVVGSAKDECVRLYKEGGVEREGEVRAAWEEVLFEGLEGAKSHLVENGFEGSRPTEQELAYRNVCLAIFLPTLHATFLPNPPSLPTPSSAPAFANTAASDLREDGVPSHAKYAALDVLGELLSKNEGNKSRAREVIQTEHLGRLLSLAQDPHLSSAILELAFRLTPGRAKSGATASTVKTQTIAREHFISHLLRPEDFGGSAQNLRERYDKLGSEEWEEETVRLLADVSRKSIRRSQLLPALSLTYNSYPLLSPSLSLSESESPSLNPTLKQIAEGIVWEKTNLWVGRHVIGTRVPPVGEEDEGEGDERLCVELGGVERWLVEDLMPESGMDLIRITLLLSPSSPLTVSHKPHPSTPTHIGWDLESAQDTQESTVLPKLHKLEIILSGRGDQLGLVRKVVEERMTRYSNLGRELYRFPIRSLPTPAPPGSTSSRASKTSSTSASAKLVPAQSSKPAKPVSAAGSSKTSSSKRPPSQAESDLELPDWPTTKADVSHADDGSAKDKGKGKEVAFAPTPDDLPSRQSRPAPARAPVPRANRKSSEAERPVEQVVSLAAGVEGGGGGEEGGEKRIEKVINLQSHPRSQAQSQTRAVPAAQHPSSSALADPLSLGQPESQETDSQRLARERREEVKRLARLSSDGIEGEGADAGRGVGEGVGEGRQEFGFVDDGGFIGFYARQEFGGGFEEGDGQEGFAGEIGGSDDAEANLHDLSGADSKLASRKPTLPTSESGLGATRADEQGKTPVAAPATGLKSNDQKQQQQQHQTRPRAETIGGPRPRAEVEDITPSQRAWERKGSGQPPAPAPAQKKKKDNEEEKEDAGMTSDSSALTSPDSSDNEAQEEEEEEERGPKFAPSKERGAPSLGLAKKKEKTEKQEKSSGSTDKAASAPPATNAKRDEGEKPTAPRSPSHQAVVEYGQEDSEMGRKRRRSPRLLSNRGSEGDSEDSRAGDGGEKDDKAASAPAAVGRGGAKAKKPAAPSPPKEQVKVKKPAAKKAKVVATVAEVDNTEEEGGKEEQQEEEEGTAFRRPRRAAAQKKVVAELKPKGVAAAKRARATSEEEEEEEGGTSSDDEEEEYVAPKTKGKKGKAPTSAVTSKKVTAKGKGVTASTATSKLGKKTARKSVAAPSRPAKRRKTSPSPSPAPSADASRSASVPRTRAHGSGSAYRATEESEEGEETDYDTYPSHLPSTLEDKKRAVSPARTYRKEKKPRPVGGKRKAGQSKMREEGGKEKGGKKVSGGRKVRKKKEQSEEEVEEEEKEELEGESDAEEKKTTKRGRVPKKVVTRVEGDDDDETMVDIENARLSSPFEDEEKRIQPPQDKCVSADIPPPFDLTSPRKSPLGRPSRPDVGEGAKSGGATPKHREKPIRSFSQLVATPPAEKDTTQRGAVLPPPANDNDGVLEQAFAGAAGEEYPEPEQDGFDAGYFDEPDFAKQPFPADDEATFQKPAAPVSPAQQLLPPVTAAALHASYDSVLLDPAQDLGFVDRAFPSGDKAGEKAVTAGARPLLTDEARIDREQQPFSVEELGSAAGRSGNAAPQLLVEDYDEGGLKLGKHRLGPAPRGVQQSYDVEMADVGGEEGEEGEQEEEPVDTDDLYSVQGGVDDSGVHFEVQMDKGIEGDEEEMAALGADLVASAAEEGSETRASEAAEHAGGETSSNRPVSAPLPASASTGRPLLVEKPAPRPQSADSQRSRSIRRSSPSPLPGPIQFTSKAQLPVSSAIQAPQVHPPRHVPLVGAQHVQQVVRPSRLLAQGESAYASEAQPGVAAAAESVSAPPPPGRPAPQPKYTFAPTDLKLPYPYPPAPVPAKATASTAVPPLRSSRSRPSIAAFTSAQTEVQVKGKGTALQLGSSPRLAFAPKRRNIPQPQSQQYSSSPPVAPLPFQTRARRPALTVPAQLKAHRPTGSSLFASQVAFGTKASSKERSRSRRRAEQQPPRQQRPAPRVVHVATQQQQQRQSLQQQEEEREQGAVWNEEDTELYDYFCQFGVLMVERNRERRANRQAHDQQSVSKVDRQLGRYLSSVHAETKGIAAAARSTVEAIEGASGPASRLSQMLKRTRDVNARLWQEAEAELVEMKNG